VENVEAPRVLGPVGATAIVAGSMLGVGILLTPPVVAASVPSLWGFAALWLAGALVAASGGLVYAELGTMIPEAGGDVVFQRRAFGRGWALLAGAVIFVGAFAGSIAAMSVALCTYQVQVLLDAALGAGTPSLSTATVAGLRGDQLAGAGVIALLTAVNALGARTSATVQTLLTVVPLVGLAALAALGLGTSLASGASLPAPPPGETTDLASAWLGVYFAYAGWPAIVYVAGEVRDPGRTLPVAVLGGTAVVAMLYGLLCAAFLVVLGWEGLAGAGEAGTALARAVLGDQAAVGMAVLVGLALLASVNATVLGGARVAWAMAKELQVAALTGLDRRGSPNRLLVLQGLLAMGLALSGTFQPLMEATTVAMLVAGAVTVLAQVRLRVTEPDRPRPFRAWAHPLPAVVYIGSTVAALALILWGST